MKGSVSDGAIAQRLDELEKRFGHNREGSATTIVASTSR